MSSVTAPRHAPRRPRRPRRLAALLFALGAAVVAPSGLATAAPASSIAAPAAAASDATATVLEGIDVSHWQGTIDWVKVAASGKKFAILKATDSTDFVDDHYATFHAAAKANGIWTGAYHFARPDATANDAKTEADWFAAHLGLGAGDLIPALDLEQSGGLAPSALTAWTKAFLDEVTLKTGVRPMVYTSPAFWKKYLADTRSIADAGYRVLWVAHWGVTAPTVPAQNWGGRGWTFWQYSNCGSVPGISGCVDLDRYNGLDLSPVAYSTFKLTAAGPSGGIKQGAAGGATVGILRTNFSADVALDVAGLPAGATATFNTNPTGTNAAALTVTMDPDPAATPTGTYPLTITGSANGLTRTTTLNLVVADGIAPTLSAPVTRLGIGKTLGSSVPVRVSWGASDPSGIARSYLQRRTNGGSWTGATLPSTAATFYDTTITNAGSIQPRAAATDTKSNTSAYVAGLVSRAVIFDQASSAVTWKGTWTTAPSSSASGGSTRYATARGAIAAFQFTGSNVALVAPKGPTRGVARVYVDHVYAGAVNLYSSTSHGRMLVFAKNWSTNGTHLVEVVVAGTAGHPRVDVDAFVRLNVY